MLLLLFQPELRWKIFGSSSASYSSETLHKINKPSLAPASHQHETFLESLGEGFECVHVKTTMNNEQWNNNEKGTISVFAIKAPLLFL